MNNNNKYELHLAHTLNNLKHTLQFIIGRVAAEADDDTIPEEITYGALVASDDLYTLLHFYRVRADNEKRSANVPEMLNILLAMRQLLTKSEELFTYIDDTPVVKIITEAKKSIAACA